MQRRPASVADAGVQVREARFHESFERAVPGESPPRRRVLLLLEWFEYEIHRGVAAYAQEAHWILEDVGGHMAHIPPAWNGDGIVALLCTHEKSPHAQFVARARRPTVDLTCELTGRRLPRVLPDNEAIGRLGAEHLLSRGFKELAFYHAYDARVESERMAGFRQAVRRAGQSFHHLDLASAPRRYQRGEHRLNYLTDMLRQLPRPLGVMAQYDTRASEVVLACERASLAVPEQVAVVGADNDPITSELGLVPLTSVDTNRFQLGYEGAALLDRLMQGEKPPRKPIRIPPKGIVVRRSSDILAVENIDVAPRFAFYLGSLSGADHRP